MRQRNNTGYTIVVQPPEGSHRPPFELGPGEVVDYPDPIAGCGAEDGAVPPSDEPAADTPPAKPTTTKKSTAKPADGGDPA